MSIRPGTCTFRTCHNIPEAGKKLCQRCLSRSNIKRQERISKGLCNNCNSPAVIGKKRCVRCSQWARDYAKAHKSSMESHRRYRNIVLDFYGHQCVCCGEANELFLTIDHINGRTNTPEKRRTGFNVSSIIARAIIKGNPRHDIRILCFNCNCGRQRNKGICPHKKVEK